MPSQYDTNTKAQVIADARLGKPSTQISKERNLPSSTAREWIREARQLATSEHRDPLLTDGEYRLAFQAQVLTDQALQSLADSDEPLHKYLVPLNIIRGTAIDKIFKSQEPRHLPISAPGSSILIIVNAQQPQEGDNRQPQDGQEQQDLEDERIGDDGEGANPTTNKPQKVIDGVYREVQAP